MTREQAEELVEDLCQAMWDYLNSSSSTAEKMRRIYAEKKEVVIVALTTPQVHE